MDVAMFAVVLSFINLALVGSLYVAWSRGRAADKRLMQALRRELLAWLQEAKLENDRPVPSWMVEP